MGTLLRCGTTAAAAGFLALSAVALAAEPDRKAFDQHLNKTLGDLINRGARLYNQNNDAAGCYRLFEGALLTVRPLLEHRPALQKAIDDGLARAARTPTWSDGAFALHGLLERVREEVAAKPADPAPSLWQRLGGEAKVKQVVADFVALAARNEQVDFTRGGKYELTDAKLADLKKKLVDMISAAGGGPYPYGGPSMRDVHKGMGITGAQFDALAADLKKALDQNGVASADRDALLQAVGATRPAIVEQNSDPSDDRAKTSGRILMDGRPLAEADVYLVARDGAKDKGAAGRTGADGRVDFKPVPPGDYTVMISKRVQKDGVYSNPVPEKYRSRATSPLRVELVKGSNSLVFDIRPEPEEKKASTTRTVRGTVVAEGRPLAGAEIRLVPEEDLGAAGHQATVDADGNFSVEVKPGRYVAIIVKSTVAVPDAWKDARRSPYRYDFTKVK